MNFAESEKYLLSLGNEVETMKLGLENIRKLLNALGAPQENYLKIQVAGTNGKGSVCAFLDSICREAEIRTGLYTSPHLVSITERTRINGKDISEEAFSELATEVRRVSEMLVAGGHLETVPTYFEQVTAMALLAFARANVQVAILETGLGGRFDATTAANAEIAAITRIDLDHQEYLGNTIEEIAAEKAAVIRADTETVVIGQQVPAAMAVIEERLRQIKGGNPTGREGAPVVIDASQAHSLPLVFPPSTLGLRGKHQIENANVAVAIADRLREHFAIKDEAVVAGLENARHPGRLEYQGRYLFDGAHNPSGAIALADFINENEQRPVTLMFGAMNDKNVGEMLATLVPLAQNVVLTRASNSRSATVDELAAALPENTAREQVRTAADLATAIAEAEALTPTDGLILVTGSLYLVGEVKKILLERLSEAR